MTKIKDDYKRIVPLAVNLLQDRLDQIFEAGTGGRGGNLDTLFSDTVTKTKLLAIFTPFAFEDAARELNIPYTFVNANGYDVEMEDNGDVTIEEKMSLMDDAASFATGNNHSKVKDSLHFVMKLKNEDNRFTEIFAALVNVPALTHEDSGWNDTVTKTKKNNNGFSSLKIHVQDKLQVEEVYGKIRLHAKGRPNQKVKYIQTDYESFS